MKIVFYNKTLISGGIEKCLELLTKEIYKNYDIDIVYTDDSILDPNIVNILKQYANVYKIENQTIICDVCVWCYLYFDYKKLKQLIKAKKNIAWIHSMPRILPNCLLDDNEFVNDMDNFVCVSNAVKNHLNIQKEGQVIHNFMDKDIKKLASAFNPYSDIDNNVLKLTVVSRLSSGKGFERLLLLTNTLKDKNINFSIKIVGKGRKKEQEIRNNFKDFQEVEFVGYQKNPYPYVKYADYLVQLSDDESWCNSITEAKILGTPVIVTNFESSKEQITNLENGIVIDLLDNNFEKYIEPILNNKQKLKDNLTDFHYENELNEWLHLFN